MPRHLREIELLELVSGRLPDADATRAREHLAQCADCAQRLDQVRQTWQLLGAWEAPGAAAPPWRFEMPTDAPAPLRLAPWRPLVGVLRMAAAIGLAVSLGAAAAWMSTTSPSGEDGQASAQWFEATPWEVWHESTPAGLAEPMLSLVLEDPEESRS